MTSAVVHRISVFPLVIPLRRKAAQAVSTPAVVEPVVVAVELTNGTVGYGEALPRPHVTDETAASIIEAVGNIYAPFLMDFHPTSFPEALEAIESLPWQDAEDRRASSARVAIELALLDATMRRFGRDIDAVVQWMGLPGFGSPGSLRQVRFSGWLSTDDSTRLLRRLRSMYWGGLRHFLLNVGARGDLDGVEQAAAFLKRPIARGRAALRVDARGRWTKDDAIDWLSSASHLPLASIEQPLPKGNEDDLQVLGDLFEVPIILDESLVTIEDGQRLIGLGVADGFNISISKCGGLIPSLRLAALARRNDVRIQLGCVAGETSILSAAGLRFLQVCPGVTWAEGCLGSSLSTGDVVAKGLRFGYGGRPPELRGQGLGVAVDAQRVTLLCKDSRAVINL